MSQKEKRINEPAPSLSAHSAKVVKNARRKVYRNASKALSLVAVLMMGLASSPAWAEVTFTADVAGSTSFPGIARFSVANSDDSFATAADEVQFGSGVTGHQIALGMHNELQSFSTFNGNVNGKSLSVPDACEGDFDAPGEYQMSLDLVPCPGNPPPHPDFDLVVRRRDADVLGLGLKGGPALATGRLRAEIRLGAQTLTYDLPFTPSATAGALMQRLDATLARQASNLKNARYLGIVDGYLLFEANTRERSRVGVTLSVDSGGAESGFALSGTYVLARDARYETSRSQR